MERPRLFRSLALLGSVAGGILAGQEAQGGVLRGRVLDSGHGVAGATVAAIPYESPLDVARREARRAPAPPPRVTTSTGGDGAFSLTLPAGAGAVQLSVSGTGYVGARLAGVFDDTETADVGDVTLSKGALLSGRVVDAHGKPVADALVRLEPGPLRGLDGGGETREARTGADGIFRVEGASPTGNRLTRTIGASTVPANASCPPAATARSWPVFAGAPRWTASPDRPSATPRPLSSFNPAPACGPSFHLPMKPRTRDGSNPSRPHSVSWPTAVSAANARAAGAAPMRRSSSKELCPI